MKTLKWIAPVIVLLCVALSLSATKSPKEAKASVPPGITEADWHSISDDFGFVLRITRRPLIQSILQQYKNRSIPENATDEEKRQIEEQREKQIAELKSLPENNVGQAEAVFFARKGEAWYTITTPPPPIRPHFIQQ
jgi:hypothetical protein